jgi:adenylate kinase
MIVLFGPAGAGKTVQGQLLAKNRGWLWLSVGQILRDSHDSEVMRTMSQGKLASTELVDEIINEALMKTRDNDRIVIDGFPRELNQAEWLIDFCKKNNRPLSLIIVLNVPEEEILNRLSTRGRIDDSPDIIKERLTIYEKRMKPILNYFIDQNIDIAYIDGVGAIDEINQRISNKLNEKNIL